MISLRRSLSKISVTVPRSPSLVGGAGGRSLLESNLPLIRGCVYVPATGTSPHRATYNFPRPDLVFVQFLETGRHKSNYGIKMATAHRAVIGSELGRFATASQHSGFFAHSEIIRPFDDAWSALVHLFSPDTDLLLQWGGKRLECSRCGRGQDDPDRPTYVPSLPGERHAYTLSLIAHRSVVASTSTHLNIQSAFRPIAATDPYLG